MTEICGTVGAIQDAGLTAGLKAATQKANEIGELYDALAPQVEALAAAIEQGEPFAMRAAMESARETVDALEAVVDAALWPVPTYAQMLNIHSR
jgi:glutamine synthetase type III